VIGIAASSVSRATTYYWDTNDVSSGVGSAAGAAADWLTNSWATGSSGSLPTGPWPNTEPENDDQAVFTGTAGTVGLDADVFANALAFQSANYAIASTGGSFHLVGPDPTITVNLPANNNTATITAPILGSAGFTLKGNSLSGGTKFLVLANSSATTPNAFAGTLTIEAGGALRLGGGAAREQIPDDVDLLVSGVVDFVTSGGASDGKQEMVRNVAVSGSVANFSVGIEADFVVNSISATATSGAGITLDGSSAFMPNAPARLVINGWSNGAGDLTLAGGRVQLNTTGASFGIGSRVLLAGNIYSTGNSLIYNNNGGTTPDDNHFDNKALDFTGAEHTIDVASGTLSFTSRTAIQFIDVTTTNPSGATLTKTGPGVWLWEYATETNFFGVNRVEEGTWRLGAAERLANNSRLEVAGGTFDMQGFSERVADVVLEGGQITSTGASTLHCTSIDVRDGLIQPRLSGSAALTKTTAGTVDLDGDNTYLGATTISDGMLLVNGTHIGGGAYNVALGATLGGSGFISAPVVVSGSLAPGTGVGTLSIDGDVTFAVNSRLAVEIAGAAADKLAVTGNLDLTAAGNVLDVTGVGTGGSWLIATYSGTLDGVFESIPAGFTVDYGTGANSQLTLFAVASLVGDYNNDGTVGAADYTVWRNSLGGAGTSLENRDPANGSGPVSTADYDSWKAHYGDAYSGGGRNQLRSVPEPDSLALAFALTLLVSLQQGLTAHLRTEVSPRRSNRCGPNIRLSRLVNIF
jgi:autotransporter-associated beta strand protein